MAVWWVDLGTSWVILTPLTLCWVKMTLLFISLDLPLESESNQLGNDQIYIFLDLISHFNSFHSLVCQIDSLLTSLALRYSTYSLLILTLLPFCLCFCVKHFGYKITLKRRFRPFTGLFISQRGKKMSKTIGFDSVIIGTLCCRCCCTLQNLKFLWNKFMAWIVVS